MQDYISSKMNIEVCSAHETYIASYHLSSGIICIDWCAMYTSYSFFTVGSTSVTQQESVYVYSMMGGGRRGRWSLRHPIL